MLVDNECQNIHILTEFFNKIININEDFDKLKYNNEKINDINKNSSFVGKIVNRISKTIYIILSFLLIIFLYYYFIYVR